MTSLDLAPSMASQLRNCRRYWLGYDSDNRADGKVSLYRSGVRHGQLNGILRVTAGRFPEALAPSESFGALPWIWWVGPDSYPGLAGDLLGAGAVEVGRLPVMAAPIDEVTDVDVPPGLTIEQVPASGSLEAWVDAYATPLGVEPDQRSAAVLMEAGHREAPQHLIRFAGRVDGRVVATSALLDNDGVAGIYVVATQESYRRRGIGAALTAAAVAEGRRRGLPLASLQATAMGRPVYERLGLRPVAEYRLFTYS
ncbi:GNAT family N-acetyltransferase [Actinoplanes sp. M2I2]|uniref:GNAT family N-acetyltransferase n=1 Tax=Actinoplanes sp. M2I2 TaxID=1734444 RepID=UPI0020206E48|nr:GNAT family N-acetyltransferase [Actinoplanes sp. M2I2]